MRAAAIALSALVSIAHAEPATCRELKPLRYAQLSSFAQRRITGGAEWETQKDWKAVTIFVVIDRAPHIARAVLESCPNIRVSSVSPVDATARSSAVNITAGSFAALSRVLQLPAVRSVQPRRPRREIDFEDPLF